MVEAKVSSNRPQRQYTAPNDYPRNRGDDNADSETSFGATRSEQDIPSADKNEAYRILYAVGIALFSLKMGEMGTYKNRQHRFGQSIRRQRDIIRESACVIALSIVSLSEWGFGRRRIKTSFI